MKVYIICPKCEFSITPEMKHAFTNGICPNCGEKIDISDLPSIYLFIDTVLKLELPLNANQLSLLVDEFFKNKLKLNYPEIIFKDEERDVIRSSTQKVVNEINKSEIENKKVERVENVENKEIKKEMPNLKIENNKAILIQAEPIAFPPKHDDFKSDAKEGIVIMSGEELKNFSRSPILHKNPEEE